MTTGGAAMADEKVRKLAEDALNRLAAELAAGKSDALKNYLDTMSRFHHYSLRNVLLIASQRPTATHVAGYHTWADLGRHVKHGEKGIMIFAPILTKQRDPSALALKQEQTVTKGNDVFRLAGFRTAFVFDVQQTEGKPLPEFAKTMGEPKEFADKLKALVANQGITLEYHESLPQGAQGISYGGKIHLVSGMQPAEEFSVLVHELAHEMLHHKPTEDRLPKVFVETQAEAVAYVVCRGVGLDTNSAAADYISLYNGDKKTLVQSLSAIQDASSRILDELLPAERPSPFHERRGERDLPSVSSPTHEVPGTSTPGSGPSAPQSPEPAISFDR
jgi:antirestriction protein ArdC